jgi:hypothetical protein
MWIDQYTGDTAEIPAKMKSTPSAAKKLLGYLLEDGNQQNWKIATNRKGDLIK